MDKNLTDELLKVKSKWDVFSLDTNMLPDNDIIIKVDEGLVTINKSKLELVINGTETKDFEIDTFNQRITPRNL